MNNEHYYKTRKLLKAMSTKEVKEFREAALLLQKMGTNQTFNIHAANNTLAERQ